MTVITSMRDVPRLLQANLTANIPSMLWGPPGVGKSDVVKELARDLDIGLIDLRATLCEPVDLRGLPTLDIKQGTARWLPPAELPDAKRHGKRGILFLDELPQAAQAVQAACFGLVLDRRLGEYHLPPGWLPMAAGNRLGDRAGAQRMPTALRNRFAHFEVAAEIGAWEAWAARAQINPLVIAFVRFREKDGLLHRMPDGDENAFPTPRAWESVAKHAGERDEVLRRQLVAGLVGEDAADQFEAFVRIWARIPSIDQILRDPRGVAVPSLSEPALIYAVAGALGRRITKQNIANALAYAKRLPKEFEVLVALDAVRRDADLWNSAGDYAINPGLLAAGFTLPDPLLDPRFHNMSADEIYAVLRKEQQDREEEQGAGDPQAGGSDPQQAPGGSPQPGQGQQGQQQGGDPGGCGQVLDAAPATQPASLSRIEGEWRVRVMQAMSAEAASHPGEIPANLKRMFESVRKQPVDWRALLRRFIDATSRINYSWTKPNRRYLGMGFIIPGMVPDGLNHVGIVLDTSGSIDKRALSRFMGELQHLLDEGATKKVTIICCDTEVKKRYDFEEGQKIEFELEGGGGTRFYPAVSWFAKNEPDIAVLVYFTDLDCSAYGDEPWVPVLWLGYGPANVIRERAAKVPFGEVLHLVD